MKNITMNKTARLFLIALPIVVCLYNLALLLTCRIQHTVYVFSPMSVVLPIVGMAVLTLICVIFRKGHLKYAT